MSRLPGRPLGRALAAALLAIVVAGAQAAPALAAGPIAVDGQFGDWAGQACLADSATDDSSPATNIVQFCWGTNAGDPTLYFELVRVTPQDELQYWPCSDSVWEFIDDRRPFVFRVEG